MKALNKKLFLYVFIFLLVCLAINVFFHPFKRSVTSLGPLDKKLIADYVYSVIDSYSQGNKTPDVAVRTNVNLDLDYEKVYISLYNNNTLLGCQSGRVKKNVRERLFLDLKDASIRTLKDSRFVNIENKKIDKDTYVVVSLLFNKKKMAQNKLAYLNKKVELGMHSILLTRSGKGACFISGAPIIKNYNLEKTLKQLCKKGGFKENCFLDKHTQINRLDTVVFKAERNKEITDLYRFNILVDQKEIKQKSILESLTLAKDWALNNINSKTNLLEYTYYPSRDAYASNNQHTRQLATLWALTELREFLKTKELDSLIQSTFNHYLANERTKDGYAYLAIDENPSIAFNAFMIMSLLNSNIAQKAALLDKLAQGILSRQLPDGSYRTNFNSDKITGIDYYPGEAMLSLMKIYKATKNTAYLDSVKKAFPYYRKYWRNKKNSAFIPWHTQAYYLLYQETADPELAEFIFEMNDWLIDHYQIYRSAYLDKIGGFPKKIPGGTVTAVYLEGINDAYALAVEKQDRRHKEKYGRSIAWGTRFILQSQFNEKNSFYLENPKRAIGGIRITLMDNIQRVDSVQHSVMALLKVYKNKIFISK